MSQALHTVLQEVGLTIPRGLINPRLTDITSDSRSVRTGSLFLACQANGSMVAASGARPSMQERLLL